MRPQEPGAPRVGSAEAALSVPTLSLVAAIVQFVRKTIIIAEV